MQLTRANTKVGVFVDVSNVTLNGGKGMRFEILREFACRGGAEPVRLNAYIAFDAVRAREDVPYRHGQQNYHSTLRDFGFKVIEKHVKWYVDDSGNRYGKANSDLDLAVDALLQSENLDSVVLVTGDGDFVQVVKALQNRGCGVEVIAFENVSAHLRREADLFLSGYLIPNLVPTSASRDDPPWGEHGSRVRGVCYHHGAGFGFLRFMNSISPALWRTDTREPDSPFESAFFHDAQLPAEVSYTELPSRNIIFEFKVNPSPREESSLVASDLTLITPRRPPSGPAPAPAPDQAD